MPSEAGLEFRLTNLDDSVLVEIKVPLYSRKSNNHVNDVELPTWLLKKKLTNIKKIHKNKFMNGHNFIGFVRSIL